tara:strand:+ start:1376 stop:2227 length:852 start_codon:yes stop_codon:yes gene_type:complete
MAQSKMVTKKHVDLLDEDKPIANQKFVCVSFISPEKLIDKKEAYFFEEFLKSWELSKSLEKFNQFVNFLSYKYELDFQVLSNDLAEFCKEEQPKLVNSSVFDEYKSFLDQNEERLQTAFDEKNNFQTSTRGIKVRGVYPSQGEAELRAKLLREIDPNFDVYVGPVGMWMPWEPDAYKTGRVEYLEEELNELMSKKKDNEDKAKDYFEKRVKETKIKAIEENIKLAKESGNKLTQSVTKDGKLIGVTELNTQENILQSRDQVSSDDVKKELFEGDNIVLGKPKD